MRHSAILPLIGVLLLTLAAALYASDVELYLRVMRHLIVNPIRTPFIDLESVLTTTRCWQQGVDVYASNPCDQLNRPMNYSPLWLRFSFLAIDRSWSLALGLALSLLYALSLAWLPPRRDARTLLICAACAFSSLSLFAIERGNLDVVIYLVCLLAAHGLTSSPPARLAAYGGLLLAGLLKFYPLVTCACVLRERPARAIAISTVMLGAIAAFVWAFAAELPRAAHNIPGTVFFGDVFSAQQLPRYAGLATAPIVHLLAPTMKLDFLNQHLFLGAVAGMLVLASCLNMAGLIRSNALRASLAGLADWQKARLFLGCALIAGCFFTGPSAGYRGILLLLCLPGLLSVQASLPACPLRGGMRLLLAAIVLVLQRDFFNAMLISLDVRPDTNALAGLAWLGFEALWWGIATSLLAILAVLCLQETATQATLRRLRPTLAAWAQGAG